MVTDPSARYSGRMGKFDDKPHDLNKLASAIVDEATAEPDEMEILLPAMKLRLGQPCEPLDQSVSEPGAKTR